MFVDKTINKFIEELKSAAPTPGGGGVSALNSAQGIALIMMVANLTVSREKYSEWHELCNSVLTEAQGLLDVCMQGIDNDAEEFRKVITAYGLPHDTEEEKSNRSKAISEASVSATREPLRIMEASVRALELDIAILGKSNPTVQSDLYVAARSLQAGLLSAKYSVDANLTSIDKMNHELAEEFRTQAGSYIDKCNALIGEVF